MSGGDVTPAVSDGDEVGLVVSPTAGKGRAAGVAARVRQGLSRRGLVVRDLTGPDPDATVAAVRRATGAGLGRVLAVGGDGTVHHLARATATTGTVIGLVPVGTGNDWARALGLPADPDAALETALGPARPLDALAVGPPDGGRDAPSAWIATVATAGFSGDVNARANAMRYPRGSARYTIATLATLPRLRPRRLVLGLDGTSVGYDDVVLVAVGNTAHFGGGMAICPGARPDDGSAEVVVVAGIGRVGLARFLPRVFGGHHVTHPAVHRHHATEISLTCPDGPLHLWGDGEPVGPLPLTLRVVPGALRVAVSDP